MSKTPPKPPRTCGDCIHEYACCLWHIGTLHNTDATHCACFESVRGCPAYVIGQLDALDTLKKEGKI